MTSAVGLDLGCAVKSGGIEGWSEAGKGMSFLITADNCCHQDRAEDGKGDAGAIDQPRNDQQDRHQKEARNPDSHPQMSRSIGAEVFPLSGQGAVKRESLR